MPDEGKTLGEDGGVSIPELDIITARGARLETNRARDHEGRGFRFGLADAFRGGAGTFSAMQELVRQFMSQGGKLLGRCLAGQECHSPTIGDATRGSDMV